MSLREQIELAQKSLRAMKRNPATRVMLPEYSELQQAKAELDRAKARLKAAQAAWSDLGEPLERRRARQQLIDSYKRNPRSHG